jgi:hypothetical protein
MKNDFDQVESFFDYINSSFELPLEHYYTYVCKERYGVLMGKIAALITYEGFTC